MSGPSVQPVLLCACLAAGLLFDPMGFLRMTLVCAFVHESGHVLAYMLCTHKLPGLHFSAGGIGLSGAEQLLRTQELWVLAAGPLANFIMAALLFLQLHRQASYALYFLAAV
ncbi:M50 family metallopeptidase, partial [Ruthenibacterium lactatiformans]